MIVLGYFFHISRKSLCYGYSLEEPDQSASNEYPQQFFVVFIKNWRNFSQKYQLLLVNPYHFSFQNLKK